ncbi:MAG: TniQ family protein [Solirubrobacteraceae bacterium]
MRLPLVCPPAPDEPQLSWLRRLAWENRCSVVALLSHCGIAMPTFSLLALGLSDDDLGRISRATSLPVELLNGLGLRHVVARAGEPVLTPELSAHQRGSTLAASYVSLDGVRRCPQCLIERQGAVSTRWLHRLSTCCITHEMTLASLPRPRAAVPEDALRTTTQPPGTPSPHRTRNTDWNRAAQAVTLDYRDCGLADAIDRILDGKCTQFADHLIPPAAVSRLIWGTVMLLARFVEVDDLELDKPRRAALTAYVARRPETRARRQEPNTRLRREHEALAALAPSAWALALGHSNTFRNDLLDCVAARIRALDRANVRIQSYHRLPAWLKAGLAERMSQTACHRLTRAKFRVSRLAGTGRGIDPAHIPQMLWTSTFETNFAPLLPTLTPHSGRALCSILLLRMGPCASLKSAALALGQRGEPSVGVQRLLKLTDQEPLGPGFSSRLQTLCQHLEATKLEADYASLRAQYEHCVELDATSAVMTVDALRNAGRLETGQEEMLMSRVGRTALASWIWVHATRSRLDKSAFHGTCPPRKTARAVAQIKARLLDPNQDALLQCLEEHHGMSLHAPALPSLE